MTTNIFGSNQDDKKKEFLSKIDSQSKAILLIIEKHKNLENSIDLLNEKVDLIDHNAIKNFKKLFAETKSLRSEILELKHEIESLKEFNSKTTKQLKLMTTKDEVMKLEKYIDLWNPMNFVTKEELKKVTQKTLEELRKIIEEFLDK